jgi:hypothetical protein
LNLQFCFFLEDLQRYVVDSIVNKRIRALAEPAEMIIRDSSVLERREFGSSATI